MSPSGNVYFKVVTLFFETLLILLFIIYLFCKLSCNHQEHEDHLFGSHLVVWESLTEALVKLYKYMIIISQHSHIHTHTNQNGKHLEKNEQK